jgi:ubiquinone/menaquinone biosynthesis C-methylase UbiE
MAKKEHWNVDPWNDEEIWSKIVGHPQEDCSETLTQYDLIFGRRHGVRCLEIGAGVGRLLRNSNKNFYEAWGVDSSPMMVALSTRYLQAASHARIVLNDGYLLPFPTEYFDFVYSFTCFQHMEDILTIQQNLQEAYRVLRPGSEILVQTVCGKRDTGRHDGYVFESGAEFAVEFHRANFQQMVSDQKGEWIWMRAKKP